MSRATRVRVYVVALLSRTSHPFRRATTHARTVVGCSRVTDVLCSLDSAPPRASGAPRVAQAVQRGLQAALLPTVLVATETAAVVAGGAATRWAAGGNPVGRRTGQPRRPGRVATETRQDAPPRGGETHISSAPLGRRCSRRFHFEFCTRLGVMQVPGNCCV